MNFIPYMRPIDFDYYDIVTEDIYPFMEEMKELAKKYGFELDIDEYYEDGSHLIVKKDGKRSGHKLKFLLADYIYIIN